MEKKQKNIKEYKGILIKTLFIISCLLFAIPSIGYYIEKGTIFKFDRYYQFLLNNTNIRTQTICYIIVLSLITILYFVIIKNRKKIFKDLKSIIIFIAIVSIVFIVVLPFTSSDIFYYLGIGRLDGTYHQNPYYTTIKEYVDTTNSNFEHDTVLMQGYENVWSNTTVVYGAVWTFICRFIATISFGNIDIGLMLFKIANVLVHLGNCYLLYKISNKKIYTLLYGLNPFILIEAIAHAHNDIFIIFFVLLAFYFLIKKKNLILSIVFIALATSIKYFTILLLPLIIIYHFKDKKVKDRLIKCIQYGIIFLLIFGSTYILYIRDISVMQGLILQQEKVAKGIYVILIEYFKDIPNVVENVKNVLLGSFMIVYFFSCIILLNKKEIKLRTEMKNINYFIIAFLFLLITNFQPWYIMWLFPCIIWQKSNIIKGTLGVSILSQFANGILLMYGENWRYGTPFIFTLIVGTLAIVITNKNIRERRIKTRYLRRKQIEK